MKRELIVEMPIPFSYAYDIFPSKRAVQSIIIFAFSLQNV